MIFVVTSVIFLAPLLADFSSCILGSDWLVRRHVNNELACLRSRVNSSCDNASYSRALVHDEGMRAPFRSHSIPTRCPAVIDNVLHQFITMMYCLIPLYMQIFFCHFIIHWMDIYTYGLYTKHYFLFKGKPYLGLRYPKTYL